MFYICLDNFSNPASKIEYTYAYTEDNRRRVAKRPFAKQDVNHMETLLVKSTDGKRELPKIFICGQYLGGVNEMRKTLNNGQLQILLDECRKNEKYTY